MLDVWIAAAVRDLKYLPRVYKKKFMLFLNLILNDFLRPC